MNIPLHPDPRVITLINTALSHGIYCPTTQLALVQCFSAVFGQTEWWREMLDDDPAIAALVRHANQRVLH
jgi:hypothetical protein